jgi:hypothetical protein
VYVTDGITAQNGGTTFTQQGQVSTGMSRGASGWLSLSVTEVHLEPGEEMLVPFTMNVPADASPGHHVAGLVVEAQPVGDELVKKEDETQFGVRVVRRMGVAVVMDVEGAHITEIGISDVRLKQQDDQGATFVIDVHNTGNVFTKGAGYLLINDLNGVELANIPWKMDTVLPGDTTSFMVTHPIHLSDGDYLLSVVQNYEEKTAFLENVGIKVRNGQPPVEDAPADSSLLANITQINPAQGLKAFDGIPRWVLVGLVLIVAVLVVIEIVVLLKLWMSRTRQKQKSPGLPVSR